jgi:signal peptidase II
VKKKLIIVAAVVATILALDQFVKIYVKTHFGPDPYPIFGDWFVMEYTENQGMAFGTTFGASKWAKLSLSIFRIVAIVAITFYLVQQARNKVKLEFLIAIGLILAGASGNLIDSMFYDYIFPIDQYLDCTMTYNLLEGSGNLYDCDYGGIVQETEIRHTGFLFGNVVDMFQFQGSWPQWMPFVAGKEIFPAIWNVADASITLGVIMVFFRQRSYFPKDKDTSKKPWYKRVFS